MKKYRKSRRAAAQAADGEADSDDGDDVTEENLLNHLLLPSTNSLQRAKTPPLKAVAPVAAAMSTSGAAPIAAINLTPSLKTGSKRKVTITTSTGVETTANTVATTHDRSFAPSNKVPPSSTSCVDTRHTFCPKRVRLPAMLAVFSLFLLFLLGLFSPYTTVVPPVAVVVTIPPSSSSSKIEQPNIINIGSSSSDKSTSAATAKSTKAVENSKLRRNSRVARVFDIYDYIDNGQMKIKRPENTNKRAHKEEDKEVDKCDLTNIKDLYRKRIARSLSSSGVDEASESERETVRESEEGEEGSEKGKREIKQRQPSSLLNVSYPYDLHHKAHWKLRDDFNAEEFCSRFPADGAARVYRGVRNAKGEVIRPTMAKLFHPPDWNSDVFEEETVRFLAGKEEGAQRDVDERHHVAFRPLKARRTPARLFYGFMFGVEFDMLDLVLHEIYPIVDKIAIIESDISHSLKRKEAVLWKATGKRTQGANIGGGSGGDIDGKGVAVSFEERFSRYFKSSSSDEKGKRGGGRIDEGHTSDVAIHPNRIGDKIHVFIFSPRKGKVYKSGWDVEMRQRNMFHHLLPSLGVRDGDIVIGNMDMDELLTATTLLKLKYCELDAANNEDERRKFSSEESGRSGNPEERASAHDSPNTALSSMVSTTSNNSPTFSIVHFRYHFGCLQEIKTAVMTDTVYVWDEEKVRKTKNLYQARKGMVNFILPALNSALNRKGWAGNPSLATARLATTGTGGGGEEGTSSALTVSLSSSALTLQTDPMVLFDIFNNNTSNRAMEEQQQQPKKPGASSASDATVWDPSLGAKREVYFATKQEKEQHTRRQRGPLAQTKEQQKTKSYSSSSEQEENTQRSFSSDSGIIDINEAFNRDLNALQGSMAWHMSTFGGIELLKFKRANSPHRFVEDGKGSDQALIKTIDACFFNDVYRARVSLWEQNAPLLLRSIDSPCRWERPKNGA